MAAVNRPPPTNEVNTRADPIYESTDLPIRMGGQRSRCGGASLGRRVWRRTLLHRAPSQGGGLLPVSRVYQGVRLELRVRLLRARADPAHSAARQHPVDLP